MVRPIPGAPDHAPDRQRLAAFNDGQSVAGPDDYVQRVRAATGAQEKIAIYSAALAHVLPVVAPLLEALRDAGRKDPDCADTSQRIEERRAGNMLLFAQDLRATGELRDDLGDQQVADLVWSTNSAEYYSLLSRRGWSSQRIGGHLADLWTRTLVDPAVWVPDATARVAQGPSVRPL